MYQIALVLFELLILLVLSNRIGKILYSIFFVLFKSPRVAIGLLTFLYLPGTVIHELAHLFTAEILRVPTGPLSFTPLVETNKHGQTDVEAGSVKIARTDPIRTNLIGLAPIFFGIFFLYLIIWIFEYFWPQMTTYMQQTLLLSLIAYLLFSVSNNMFSSKKDLEGLIYLIPILILLFTVIYFAGIRIQLTPQTAETITSVFALLSKALGIVIGVNLGILLINLLVLQGILKLKGLNLR